MSILSIVKTLLGIKNEDISKDTLLTLYVNIITQRIINYCNISKLPDELILTAAQMVVDIFAINVLDSENTGKVVGPVSSISEGGTSVSFATNSKAISIAAQADERISKMKELNRFKSLYKV